jgi:hypothetical protein
MKAQPKVGQLGLVAVADEYVVALKIGMNNPLGVQIQQLERSVQQQFPRFLSALGLISLEVRVELSVSRVLTHEERIRSDMAGAKELDHMRVIELKPQVDFVLESQSVELVENLNPLHNDGCVQLATFVDLPESARAEKT